MNRRMRTVLAIFIPLWLGLMGGILAERIRTKPIIANYEAQIDLVVGQRDKAKSELATFQAILKQLVDGGWKED
jgi:hypothetical protein